MIIQNNQASHIGTIKIDGKVECVWKADVEKVEPNPHLVRSHSTVTPPLSARKGVDRLKLATSTCRVRLLTAERCVIYVTGGFIPPDAVASIDTKSKMLRTISGACVPVRIFVARLSPVESVFVQNAIKNADDKKLGETLEELKHDLKAVKDQAVAGRLIGQNASKTEARSVAKGREAYVFRKAGQFWTVVFDGGAEFHIRDTLGAKYLANLLHHPNQGISAYDLEVAIQPGKGKARAKNSIQDDLDPQTVKSCLRELSRLRSQREQADDEGNQGESARLNDEIDTLEDSLKKKGHAEDTGERSRNNVRKAITAVCERLSKGGKNERDFLQHINHFVSTGYECIYNQPKGSIWA